MPPKNIPNPLKKSVTSNSSFPGLKSPTNTRAKSQYEEIQDDELIALSSIYGDDFEEIRSNGGAWKKAEPCFKIRIRSEDSKVGITLKVTFVATYPRSQPLLLLEDDERLRDVTKHKLENVLQTKPKELAAEEQPMIMEIVDTCREILDEAAIDRAAGEELPSLEEERALHEAEAAKIARQKEEEQDRKKQKETEEEERVLQDMVQDELKRQKVKASEAKRRGRPSALRRELTLDEDPDEVKVRVIFDQPISFLDQDGDARLFQAVTDMTRIRHGAVADCFTVKPILKISSPKILVLKQLSISSLESDVSFKNMRRQLETELQKGKKSSHRNVMELYDYKIERGCEEEGEGDLLWTVSILTEYGNKGSLEELLDISSGLGVEKVRAWTIELLDALRYLHDSGIIHQDLHVGNVLLVRSNTGEVTPKSQMQAIRGIFMI